MGGSSWGKESILMNHGVNPLHFLWSDGNEFCKPYLRKIPLSSQFYTDCNHTLCKAHSPQRTVTFYSQTCFHSLCGAEHFVLIRKQKFNSKQHHFLFMHIFYECSVSIWSNLHSHTCIRIPLHQEVYQHGMKMSFLLRGMFIRQEMAGWCRQWVMLKQWDGPA